MAFSQPPESQTDQFTCWCPLSGFALPFGGINSTHYKKAHRVLLHGLPGRSPRKTSSATYEEKISTPPTLPHSLRPRRKTTMLNNAVHFRTKIEHATSSARPSRMKHAFDLLGDKPNGALGLAGLEQLPRVFVQTLVSADGREITKLRESVVERIPVCLQPTVTRARPSTRT